MQLPTFAEVTINSTLFILVLQFLFHAISSGHPRLKNLVIRFFARAYKIILLFLFQKVGFNEGV